MAQTMTILAALSKSARHLQQGSFLKTVASYLRARAQQRRMRWWDAQAKKGRRCLLAYSVSGVRTNLYFDSHLCRGIYLRGFEDSELDFVGRFLHTGDVFLDIGANIGIYSLLASKRVGPAGKVYSFEPHRKTFDRLQENVAHHGQPNITCHNLAVSDVTGKASLNVSMEGFDAWNSLANPTRGSTFDVENVATIGLDDLCAIEGLAADMLTMVKIDVEGWESHVLAGGERQLSHPKAPLLQIEFSAEACRNNGSCLDTLANQVSSLGYALHIYDAMHKTLTAVRGGSDCVNKNVLCIKDVKRVADRSGVAVVS